MEVAEDTISITQTAFINDRFILEGVLVLHEVVNELRVRKQKGIIMKLDFEKVYDKVNWELLEEVLVQKSFLRRWINWVM
jgi:hypothetical protein